MKADAFITRLEKARATGKGTWIACCPSHADKHPSMTIRELDDGRVLVHCFAGCDIAQILGAVGMDFDALFPDRLVENARPLRRPFPAADVLEAVAFETLFVVTAAGNVRQGVALTDADRARLLLASERILSARDIALG